MVYLLLLGFIFSSKIKVTFYKKISKVQINYPVVLGTVFLIISSLAYLYVLKNIGGISQIIDAIRSRLTAIDEKAYLLKIVELGTISAIMFLHGGFKKTSLVIILITFIEVSTFGSREHAFFSTIFTYLIFYHYTQKRLSVLKLGIIGIFALIFAVVMGNLRYFGELSLKGESLKSILFSAAEGKSTAEILPALVGSLLRGDFEYEYGKTLINIIFAPIPRSIWENKPIIDETGIIGYKLMCSDFWGLPAREYGVAFLNFGLFGVLLFSLLTGILVGVLYKNLIKSKEMHNFWTVLIYATTIRNAFNFISTSAQINIILLYVMNKFIFKKNTKT